MALSNNNIIGLGLIIFGIFYAVKGQATVTRHSYIPGQVTLSPQEIETMNYNRGYSSTWEIPEKGLKFAGYFDDAERRYSLPEGILSRMAYQESRFRDDIITGEVKSSAGATGLMQIIPRYHPNVDPLDPVASIYYAAKYLKGLYNQFGTWAQALAAYNWGPGNLDEFGIANAPSETRNYVMQISNDIGIG